MNLLFSVDTECWFHANYDGIEPFDRYAFDDRLEHNIDTILELLEECGIRATFFVLSGLADTHKNALEKISKHSHEIASHGISHRLLSSMSRQELETEISTSKTKLEDTLGIKVNGYRAASWSLSGGIYDDFYEILAKNGYLYSSSLYPAKKKLFGINGANSSPHIIKTKFGSILEFPCTTAKICGFRSGFSGGSFLRIFPFWLVELLYKKAAKDNGVVDFYIHPREIDEKGKRLSLSPILSFVHYHGISGVPNKIRKISRFGKFRTFSDFLDNY